MLNTHAFSHYRDVLGYVNWSPIMGKWLSSLQNQKAVDFDGDGQFDAFPDENLARENMQLFSIGLFQLWSDGTLKLSPEGRPQPTYTNDDIREFAKVLTGQSISQYTFFNDVFGGAPHQATNTRFDIPQNPDRHAGSSFLYPMKMFGDFHALGTKTFAGVTVDNTSITDPTIAGIADVEAAIDWLAGKPGDGLPDYDMVNSHVSTPAFISRRLIQRFTTSNPSRDYLHRVATVFKTTEGDLGQTLRAILLDPDARNIDLNDNVFGMKKSPLESLFHMLRALDGFSHMPLTDPTGDPLFAGAVGDYSNPELYLENFDYPSNQLDNFTRNVRFLPGSTNSGTGIRGLQMDPFRQLTVFNYYLPDYAPAGIISAAGLVAPELQLANEPDIMRNINYHETFATFSPGRNGTALGIRRETQQAAFGGDEATRFNEAIRIARNDLAEALTLPLGPHRRSPTAAMAPPSTTTAPPTGAPAGSESTALVTPSPPATLPMAKTGQ